MAKRKPVKRIHASNLAWAIETGEKLGSGYIGRHYFNDLQTGRKIPMHTTGCHRALFTTRKGVRTALASMKPAGGYKAFPNARVVRVSVTVTTIGRG